MKSHTSTHKANTKSDIKHYDLTLHNYADLLNFHFQATGKC